MQKNIHIWRYVSYSSIRAPFAFYNTLLFSFSLTTYLYISNYLDLLHAGSIWSESKIRRLVLQDMSNIIDFKFGLNIVLFNGHGESLLPIYIYWRVPSPCIYIYIFPPCTKTLTHNLGNSVNECKASSESLPLLPSCEPWCLHNMST